MKISTITLIAAALLVPVLATQAKQEAAAPVSKTFKVTADTKIHVGENAAATLADLKAGDKVGISYQDNNGTLMALKIHANTEPKPKTGEKKGEKHKGTPKSDTELHAHGAITSIDTTAGTITVDVQQGHHKK